MSTATAVDEIEKWEVATQEAQMLLDDVLAFLQSYVVFSSQHESVAVALWVIHTYMLDEFETTPRLVIRSPEKQAGKTRLLEVLNLLCKSSAQCVDMSVATFFRLINDVRPTILQDEADALFGNGDSSNEEKRAAYNAGYRRGAKVWRVINFTQPTPFDVFSAVAFAGIGDLPDTIMDRSVVVNMRRKTKLESVEPFRARLVNPLGEHLSNRIEKWAESAVRYLEIPEMPQGISDRQADVWEPLVMIADLANPEWGSAARTACVNLTVAQATDDADSSAQLRLLRDLRTVFGADEDRVATDVLLQRLYMLDESPWAVMEYGRLALDALKMSKLLKPFGVRPARWTGTNRVTTRGYLRSQLEDAWSRYLGVMSGDVG